MLKKYYEANVLSEINKATLSYELEQFTASKTNLSRSSGELVFLKEAYPCHAKSNEPSKNRYWALEYDLNGKDIVNKFFISSDIYNTMLPRRAASRYGICGAETDICKNSQSRIKSERKTDMLDAIYIHRKVYTDSTIPATIYEDKVYDGENRLIETCTIAEVFFQSKNEMELFRPPVILGREVEGLYYQFLK